VTDVSIRDLRNHGGEIVDRAAAGERIIITRAGKPVAELVPLQKRPLTAEALIDRWRHLEPVVLGQFRADIDAILDPSL
jgi:prevent-host-death family protein